MIKQSTQQQSHSVNRSDHIMSAAGYHEFTYDDGDKYRGAKIIHSFED